MRFVEEFLKEFAMQSPSDLVFDVPSGESGSLKIPISGPMFKEFGLIRFVQQYFMQLI